MAVRTKNTKSCTNYTCDHPHYNHLGERLEDSRYTVESDFQYPEDE